MRNFGSKEPVIHIWKSCVYLLLLFRKRLVKAWRHYFTTTLLQSRITACNCALQCPWKQHHYM